MSKLQSHGGDYFTLINETFKTSHNTFLVISKEILPSKNLINFLFQEYLRIKSAINYDILSSSIDNENHVLSRSLLEKNLSLIVIKNFHNGRFFEL